MKITNNMKDAVVAISQGKEPLVGFETMLKCVEAGLLSYEDSEYFLTPKGSKLASERKGQVEKQKTKRNRGARARHAAMTGLGLKRTRSGAYESVEEGLWDGPDDSAQIIAAIQPHLKIGDRQIRFRAMKPGVWIDYINLPKGVGGAGGGAEAENNRFALNVEPKGDKYKVDTKVSAIGRQYKLRGRTAPLDKLGQYIAKHLNKLAKEVEPKFTHTKRESLRTAIGALRSLI